MLFFATFFDKNYLSRGLVLYYSLKEYCSSFSLYVLCLDEFTFEYFESNAGDFPAVRVLSIAQIEEWDRKFLKCKSNRTKIEYYFTLSPCLPLYLLKKFSLPHVCTLDADILFLNSPKPLFDYIEKYSIVITPHKFSKQILAFSKWGNFNVSFQIFKNDDLGIKCLEKWRDQCIEWCGDYMDEINLRFADQKYLDTWVNDYAGKVKVLDDDVSGIAPWNLNNYKINEEKNIFYSNGKPLIFFHFHSFKILSKSWVSNGFHGYKTRNQKGVAKLYFTYWKRIEAKQKLLNISVDLSVRHSVKENVLQKVLKENDLYGRFFNLFIFSLSFTNQYKFYKRVKKKIYGVFNRS
jgi:hypothetical protein